jgi:rhodanese-related sulfurtransferase
VFGQLPDVEHVSAAEAIELAAGESILVDVRESWEWDLGHAPEAINLPMSQLDARHEELPLDATLLIVCHSGQRSLSVTDALARAGYNAVNVDGGMIAWQLSGGMVVADGSETPRV